DGSLRGSFHNPDVNWTGRAPWFRVVEKEGSLELIDPATGKTRFVQPYDKNQQQIAMDFGTPIALTPRAGETAVGFQPRTPAQTAYRYRVPLARGDGWKTARARDVGLDEERLRDLVQHLLAIDPADPNAPRVHSLLVARRGKLVLEEYFFGYSAERPHDLRSASKSLTSLMAGIAMDKPPSLTIDTPIAPSSTITLAHLLTHSSGLACDDDDEQSPGNEDVMQGQQKQRDWYRYFLDLPAAHAPGTKYAYCSAGINFAGGMIAKASGAWLPEFFDRHIARPMQIERYHVNLMPDGQGYSGGGIYMRPRDFLKFGPLMLGGGTWNGTRIVSRQWVEASTAHRIATSSGGSDGYAWHRYKLGGYEEYEASGNGGQFLIVVPELDLAVVFTAGNYGQYRVWKTFREELVRFMLR
ncbi:MAG TPA: serine hydrolase, partial [Thermoanaerobaculia bacterium]|nr:serine hydrolase [Thermoanaerobaculia bacterium]